MAAGTTKMLRWLSGFSAFSSSYLSSTR